MPPALFAPGPSANTVRAVDGSVRVVPDGWVLVAPGDPGLTRRVKSAGEHWVVHEKMGRRMIARGVWAKSETVERIRADLEVERSTAAYARRGEAATKRRDQAQVAYVEDFVGAVVAFLAFDPRHADLAGRMARAVADHATPVGSGTVARTKRIAIERRAEAAVIAWMRHRTTAYDSMAIPRVQGQRWAVRRELAGRSVELLGQYRRGELTPASCPLKKALGAATNGRLKSAVSPQDKPK